jgi:hypothetical protein
MKRSRIGAPRLAAGRAHQHSPVVNDGRGRPGTKCDGLESCDFPGRCDRIGVARRGCTARAVHAPSSLPRSTPTRDKRRNATTQPPVGRPCKEGVAVSCRLRSSRPSPRAAEQSHRPHRTEGTFDHRMPSTRRTCPMHPNHPNHPTRGARLAPRASRRPDSGARTTPSTASTAAAYSSPAPITAPGSPPRIARVCRHARTEARLRTQRCARPTSPRSCATVPARRRASYAPTRRRVPACASNRPARTPAASGRAAPTRGVPPTCPVSARPADRLRPSSARIGLTRS